MVSTSSRIADASSVAATPVGGRPTRTPASMSSLDWPYRYRPTSSRSGRSMTSRSCADPTEPVAHWMTLIIATTPLARSEARISFNRILDRMAHLRIDEAAPGPADDRTYTYDPTSIMRGLSELHVKFTPVDAVN